MLRAIAGPDMVVLARDVQIRGENLSTVGDFTVQRRRDVLLRPHLAAASHLPVPEPVDAKPRSRRRRNTGASGIALTYRRPVPEPVLRSLITLKALTYGPTGGIVAAPTTSLPEQLGGARNWDYRYCWLRDATLTLLALMDAGYYDEAQAWRDWLLRAVAGSPSRCRSCTASAGERRLTEWEVPWLPGYEGSRPVRIGNAAHGQFQLDVYGEVIDALHQARRGGLAGERRRVAAPARAASSISRRSGASPTRASGRSRGHAQHFTTPRSWPGSPSTARSRAPSSSASRARSSAGARCATRSTPRSARKGFDAELGTLRPGVRLEAARREPAAACRSSAFSPPTTRASRHGARHRARACCVDGFVLRYDTAPNRRRAAARRGRIPRLQLLARRCLVLLGRHDEARDAVRAAARAAQRRRPARRGVRPAAARQVGNFPQAFSHVALVNTAFNIQRAERRAAPRRTGTR